MDRHSVILVGRVLHVRRDHLLVRDCRTGQEVRVNTPRARRFRRGESVVVQYSGAMTMSIPPQISAQSIMRNVRC